MSNNSNSNEHARTEARTAEHNQTSIINLLRAVEEGDEVLYRAGGSKGATNPVKPLTVTESRYRTSLIRPHTTADDNHRLAYKPYIDAPDFSAGESYNTEDYNHPSTFKHDKTNLLVETEYDEWQITVEGPQGGEYQLVEDNGTVYHRAVSHNGLGGRVRWLSLESRDGDEDAAQAAYDDALSTDAATTRHGERPIVFQNNRDVGARTEGLVYRVEINDDDEFVVTPTTDHADLHIYKKDGVSGRGSKVYTHVFFEDDYETFVEQGVKDDVFKKGGSLDWNTAHQKCHKNLDWQWSVAYDKMDYVLEHLAEQGHAVTVARDLAKRAGNEHYAKENPGAQVPGLDSDGRPVDDIEFREDDSERDESDTQADTEDDAADDTRADTDDNSAAYSDDSVAATGYRMCDGGTVEDTMAAERDGFDLLTDEGGVAFTDVLRMAADHGLGACEAADRLREYGLFPVDARGNELDNDELSRLSSVAA